MKTEAQEKALNALRTTTVKQCTGTLADGRGGMCALGVIVHAVDPSKFGINERGYLYAVDESDEVYAIGGNVFNYDYQDLYRLNDGQKLSFNRIADILEKGLTL